MRVVVAVVVIAALAAGCDDSTARGYSAEKFKRCIEREHTDVITLTRGKGYTAALLWWPTFAEWVYFYKTAEAASAQRARLRVATTRNRRILRQLLRTQRANTLVFAPAQKDWLAPIQDCLERARV